MLLKMYLLNRISGMNVSSAVVVLGDAGNDGNHETVQRNFQEGSQKGRNRCFGFREEY